VVRKRIREPIPQLDKLFRYELGDPDTRSTFLLTGNSPETIAPSTQEIDLRYYAVNLENTPCVAVHASAKVNIV